MQGHRKTSHDLGETNFSSAQCWEIPGSLLWILKFVLYNSRRNSRRESYIRTNGGEKYRLKIFRVCQT